MERYFSTLFKLHASKKGAPVHLIRGKNEYTSFGFVRFFLFYFIWVFIIILFLFFISSQNCPYAFYKTEPFISFPILSALNPKALRANVILEKTNPELESRSFYINGFLRPSDSFNDDFTRENANESNHKFDESIRFTSLGLAVRNIFNDMIVRRIAGFARLLRLASDIYSWTIFSHSCLEKIR